MIAYAITCGKFLSLPTVIIVEFGAFSAESLVIVLYMAFLLNNGQAGSKITCADYIMVKYLGIPVVSVAITTPMYLISRLKT
jgi:hypothetical protein